MSISKSTYLFILLLIGLKCCQIAVFNPIFEGQATHAILMGSWLLYGYYKWGDWRNFSFYYKEKKIWYILMLGIIASFITLYITVGQGPIYSTWLYRDILLTFFAIPLLLVIGISKEEVLTATWYFSLFYGFAFLLSIISPAFIAKELSENYELNKGEHDIGLVLFGFEYHTVPLYYLLQRYTTFDNRRRNLYKILYLYSIIFLTQNRSVLFVATIFIAWAFLRSYNWKLKVSVILGIIVIFLNPNTNPLEHLIKETGENLADDDGNRNLAWAYFSQADTDSFLHFMCGRGIESTHYGDSMAKMYDLFSIGIFPSDVGYWGFMYTFGIIPVLVFLYSSCIVLINRCYSMGTKMLGFHILICGLTISYFNNYEHGLWFVLFFVLMALEHNTQNSIN